MATVMTALMTTLAHRKGAPSAVPKSSHAGRARLQPCQKTAAPKALPLCRRPEWRRSRNDPFPPPGYGSTATELPQSSRIGRARLQPCQKAATPEGHGFSRAKKQPRRRRFRSAEGRSGGAAETTRFCPPPPVPLHESPYVTDGVAATIVKKRSVPLLHRHTPRIIK